MNMLVFLSLWSVHCLATGALTVHLQNKHGAPRAIGTLVIGIVVGIMAFGKLLEYVD